MLITKRRKSIFIIRKPGLPHLNQVLLKVSITNYRIHQYYMYFQVTHFKENHLTFAGFLPKTHNPIMRKHQKTQSEVRHRGDAFSLCPHRTLSLFMCILGVSFSYQSTSPIALGPYSYDLI